MRNPQHIAFNTGVAAFTFLLLYTLSSLSFMAILGNTAFVFFSAKFFNDLANKIIVKDVIIAIALLQWVVGPTLSYMFYQDIPIFYMAVEEETYMSYVIPAVFAFIAGLYFPLFRRPIDENYMLGRIKQLIATYPYLDFLLLGIGFISIAALRILPNSLWFVAILLSSGRFIGLFFLVINPYRPYKWWLFGATLLLIFVSVLGAALFHAFLLWSLFLLIIIGFLYKFSVTQKLLFLVGFVFFLFIIQTVKHTYRNLSSSERGLSSFSDMAVGSIKDEEGTFSEENLLGFVVRINQGWIIARVLHYVPTYEPFADGETVKEAVIAALVPRFIYQDKASAGGKANFTRFTGLRIGAGTSMDISLVGEAYVNYGRTGGMVFMFIIGLFYSFLLYIVFLYTFRHPSLVLWIPMIFLQTVKAETDLVTTLNYAIKAVIMVAIIFWGMRRFLNIRM